MMKNRMRMVGKIKIFWHAKWILKTCEFEFIFIFHLKNAWMHEFPSRNTWNFLYYQAFLSLYSFALCCYNFALHACRKWGGVEHIISGKFCYFFFKFQSSYFALEKLLLFFFYILFSRVEKQKNLKMRKKWNLILALFTLSLLE